MNKRTIGAICLLALMTMTSLLQSCAEAQPSFEALSLDITPPNITTGEKATIEVEIRNNDTKEATYNVPLMVNGVADDRRSITLAPGETKLLTFMLTKNHPGTYSISVGRRESTVVVEKPLPPDFHLSNLEINPSEVNTGENVIVTAKIANIGGTQGTYIAELKIDGITDQTEKIIIPAGTDYMFVFKVSRDSPGTYTVALGEFTGKFVVLEPVQPIQLINPPACPPSGGCGPGG